MVFTAIHCVITGPRSTRDTAKSYVIPSEDFKMRVEYRNNKSRVWENLHFDSLLEFLGRPGDYRE